MTARERQAAPRSLTVTANVVNSRSAASSMPSRFVSTAPQIRTTPVTSLHMSRSRSQVKMRTHASTKMKSRKRSASVMKKRVPIRGATSTRSTNGQKDPVGNVFGK